MGTRRNFLKYIGGAAVGGGVVFGVTQTNVLSDGFSILPGLSGPPDTDVKIKTVTQDLPNSLIPKIDLYKSGAAQIWFQSKKGCFTKVKLHHSDKEPWGSSYQTWSLPEFEGPLTVDLMSITRSNGPYPNRDFELTTTASERNSCISVSGVPNITFSVPKSWV